ncbi:SGNH/GDSL hydrolase family protein [Jeotgalibacillus sp. ET6]|uniref:SGNH/GDSL hydrolase family protein n=1 Tax=Jeotgalibacillus sp. ET6 TaxID=3037260 RepID=UPI0024185E5A|nr:SGNH/GDSL hydrolase family protein [Jeotgalibacillus sp. ET6]MDG5472755.1 SGNH/GDSL hydrolase family protein [Jeotgalibacillus sp. ET6]
MKKLFQIILASAVLLVLLGMVRGEYRYNQVQIQQTMERINPAHNPDISYLEFLTYRVMKNGSARVATLGSSVTKGVGASSPNFSWRALLQQDIRDASRPLRHVTVSNHGHSGYTSVMLLNQDVLTKVFSSRPDLIILETSVINNYRRSVTLDDTKKSIEQLYSTFKRELPGVEILFISPNPILKENLDPSGLNQLGLTFEEYVDFTQEIILDNGWNYFDTHGHMLAHMDEQNIEKKDILNDKIHPNDLGYRIWHEELYFNALAQPYFGQK